MSSVRHDGNGGGDPWILCVAVVAFDLDVGQLTEAVYPSGVLDKADAAAVASLAFPDSNTSGTGDQSFCFRVRLRAGAGFAAATEAYGFVHFRQRKTPELPRGFFQKSLVILSRLPLVALFERAVNVLGPLFFDHGSSSIDSALNSIARWPRLRDVAGSLVELPFFGRMLLVDMPALPLLNAAVGGDALGTHGDDGGDEAKREEDGFLRPNRRRVSLLQQQSAAVALGVQGSEPVGWFADVNVFRAFKPMLGNLWMLWELVLTGEPLMVVADSPAACSRAVLAAASLISPLSYRGDTRPYFTIYDDDFRHFTSLHDASVAALPAALIGVTNPFFLKAMGRFPHIAALAPPPPPPPQGEGEGEGKEEGDAATPIALQRTTSDGARGGSGIGGWEARPLRASSAPEHKQPAALSAALCVRSHAAAGLKGGGAGTSFMKAVGGASVLVTEARATLQPNTGVLRQCVVPQSPLAAADCGEHLSVCAAVDRDGDDDDDGDVWAHRNADQINNALLRKELRRLTDTFLRPLRLFFEPEQHTLPAGVLSLGELEGRVREEAQGLRWNPYLEVPQLPPFSEEEFKARLGEWVTPQELAIYRVDRIGRSAKLAALKQLYERFFVSPNFYPWFNERRDSSARRLERARLHWVLSIHRGGNAALPFFLDGLRVRHAKQMYLSAMRLLRDLLGRRTGVEKGVLRAIASHAAVIRGALPSVLLDKLEAEDNHLADTLAQVERLSGGEGRRPSLDLNIIVDHFSPEKNK